MARELQRALLVIDIQRGILGSPSPARKEAILRAFDETVARVVKLMESAREASIPVIFVQHDGGVGDRLERNTEGWQLHPQISPKPGEVLIHKRACDAFFETPLSSELARYGAKELIVCGCMTQYCIDTTVRRAVSLGYDVVLASDGHMTTDTRALSFEQIIEHHNALLDGFDAGAHSVRVQPCSQLLSNGLK